MTIGFASDLDVDLNLVADDREDCIVCPGKEAVMEGVINAPCGCRQTLCVTCYDRSNEWVRPGSSVWCYLCPKFVDGPGYFEGWVTL